MSNLSVIKQASKAHSKRKMTDNIVRLLHGYKGRHEICKTVIRKKIDVAIKDKIKNRKAMKVGSNP